MPVLTKIFLGFPEKTKSGDTKKAPEMVPRFLEKKKKTSLIQKFWVTNKVPEKVPKLLKAFIDMCKMILGS